jgi:hypothetical protein
MHIFCMVRDRVLSMFVAVASHGATSCILQCPTGRSQFTCSLLLTEDVRYITLSWYKIRYDTIQYPFPAKWCNNIVVRMGYNFLQVLLCNMICTSLS